MPPKRAFLQTFTPANWIQIGLIVFALVGGYFRVEGRQTQTEKETKALRDAVTKMDAEGTTASQRGIAKDVQLANQTQALANSNQQRIGNAEGRIDALVPKVERIDTNVQWIMDWMKNNRK